MSGDSFSAASSNSPARAKLRSVSGRTKDYDQAPSDAPKPAEQTPAKSELKYVEIDVRKGLLTSFFAEDQSGKRAEEDNVIARISDALNEKKKVGLIFDVAIKPLLTGDMQETLTLRVYDLSEPANKKLASKLPMPNVGKSYFLLPTL